MTVLSRTDYPEYEYTQQGHLFAAHRRYDGSRPVQGMTRRTPALLSANYWWKALSLALLFALIMAVVVLFIDVGSLCASRADIDQLSARIESLNSNKVQLQEELALAMNHPVLRRSNSEEEEGTVITLTAAVTGITESDLY